MTLLACPDRKELVLFTTGRLDDSSVAEIASHLDSCADCRATLEEISASSDPLEASLRQSGQIPFSHEVALKKALAFVEEIGFDASRAAAAPVGTNPARAPFAAIGGYEILEKLGEGGMGTVYKARHTRLKKIVALKVLPTHRLADAHAVARFGREMEAVGKLEHVNLVRAMDAGEIDGTHFLVMEYVQGSDLSHLVRQRGPLPIADACELVRQAALGLQSAHEHGLVHRDIKPSNLMLSASGSVKILDLGLALLAGENNAARELTSTGQLMGTIDYMAPEQGSSSHKVDIRADIYSLGATLYKLLTGQAPFGSDKYITPMEKMVALATIAPPPVESLRPDVPRELAAVVAKMLAREPGSRYSTPAEVATALQLFAKENRVSQLLLEPEPRTPETTAEESSVTENHLSDSMTGTESSASFGNVTEPMLPSPTVVARTATAPETKPVMGRRGGKGSYPPTYIAIAAGLLLMAAAGAYYGITVLIKDKQGNVVSKVEVADGTKLEVEQNGKKIGEIDTAKPTPPTSTAAPSSAAAKPAALTPAAALAVQPVNILPEKLPPLSDNAPLSATALVARPAKLPGVESWTVETKKLRGSTRTVKFSPDSKLLATGGTDGVIRIWNASTGKFIRMLVGHGGPIGPPETQRCYRGNAIDWSADSKMIVACSLDGQTKIWNVDSGKVVRSIDPPSGAAAFCVSWSPDSQLLAIGYSDGSKSIKTRIHNVADGAVIASIEGNAFANAWSHDSQRLACYGESLSIWGRANRSTSKEIKVGSSPRFRHGLAWSADNRWLAVGDNGGIKIFDSNEGVPVSEVPKLVPDLIYVTAFWLPDSENLIALESHGHVNVFTKGKDKLDRTFPLGGGADEAFGDVSQNGKWIATTVSAAGVAIGDMATGQRIVELPSLSGQAVSDVAFSADGQHLATGSASSVGLWDLSDFSKSATSINQRELPTIGISFSPDSKQFAYSSSNSVVYAADAATGTAKEIARASRYPSAIAWSPNGKQFVFHGDVHSLTVWDTEKKAVARRLDNLELVEGYDVLCVNWSPNGEWIASGNHGGVVQFWNLLDDQKSFLVHKGFGLDNGTIPENGMFWSKDSKSLAVQSGGRFTFVDLESKRALPAWDLDAKDFPGLIYKAEESSVPLARFEKNEVEFHDPETGAIQRRLTFGPYPAKCAIDRPHGIGVYWISETESAYLFALADGRKLATLVQLPDDGWASISPEGHLKSGSPLMAREFSYVVQTADGQQTLSPAEFAEKYGWKNDPSKVRLAGP